MTKDVKDRIDELKLCKTPEEIACLIWSEGLEKATGRSKKPYRDGFIDWIESYKLNKEAKWNYKTPQELAEGVYPTFYLDNDGLYSSLRKELVEWINKYKNG